MSGRKPRDLAKSIRDTRAKGIIPIIGEIKPRSPSEGRLREAPDTVALVGELEDAGAAGISILTEPVHFGGSKALLSEASCVAKIPLLRKDFLVYEEEIVDSWVLGADSVLLIVRLLGDRLEGMYEKALNLGLNPLVEVHTKSEMELAAQIGAGIIGINNRDLSDLTINLENTAKLSRYAPDSALVVSESGYTTAEQVARMERHCDAFLIGSALMRGKAGDVMRELQGRTEVCARSG